VSKFLNYQIFLFFKRKKRKKICKHLGNISKDLAEFTKILIPESLKVFFLIYIYIYNKKHGRFENFDEI
jgi:hypothetical protein